MTVRFELLNELFGYNAVPSVGVFEFADYFLKDRKWSSHVTTELEDHFQENIAFVRKKRCLSIWMIAKMLDNKKK